MTSDVTIEVSYLQTKLENRGRMHIRSTSAITLAVFSCYKLPAYRHMPAHSDSGGPGLFSDLRCSRPAKKIYLAGRHLGAYASLNQDRMMNQWQQPITYANTPPDQHPTVYQPLHPSLRTLLDPEYVAFHDSCVQYLVPDEQMTWTATTRSQLPSLSGGSMPLRVGLIRDVPLENCRVRMFVPESSQRVAKYPVLYWLHGGGWATGGVDSENDFLTYLCQSE